MATMVLLGCAAEPVGLSGTLGTDPPVDPPPVHPYNCNQQLIAGGVRPYSTCDGQEEQGRNLLGSIADTLAGPTRHFSVAAGGWSVSGQTLTGGTLPAAFTGRGGVQVFVTQGPSGYIVQYRQGGRMNDYCDPMVNPNAIPMAGEWTVTGLHDNTANRITFACQDSGKAATCVAWGYDPGAGGPGVQEWDLHQACTQMARADYCGNGIPHTEDLTPIWIRDTVPTTPQFPPNQPPSKLPSTPTTYPADPPPDDVYFESVWYPRQPAQCLSKLRWAAFPINFCNGTPADPRFDPTAKYCEEKMPDFTAVTLANGSKSMDLALYRWGKTGSTNTVTTARGYVVDPSNTKRKNEPPAGYDKLLGAEGFLLRNFPGSIPQSTTTEVDWLTSPDGKDTVVAFPSDFPDYAVGTKEGYVYNDQLDNTVALYLYESDDGTDWVTSVATTLDGYDQIKSLGYVTAPTP